MKDRATILSILAVLVTIALWGGYGFMLWQLSDMRARLGERGMEDALRDERNRNFAQLQAFLRDTKDARESLAHLTSTDALAAAATIEAAGRKAGVLVTIGGAVSSPLVGTPSEDLRMVTMVANTEGSFDALMDAAMFFESLPFPSRIESYDLSRLDQPKGKKEAWRMTARIRILIPSETHR